MQDDGTYLNGKKLESLFEAFGVKRNSEIAENLAVAAIGCNRTGKPPLSPERVLAVVREHDIEAIEYVLAQGVWQGEKEQTVLVLFADTVESEVWEGIARELDQRAIYLENRYFTQLVWGTK